MVAIDPELGDEDLNLQGLHLVGEDLAEVLRVQIRERACVHVVTGIGETLRIGVANAGDAQLVELVVLANAGESDTVVDLAHLVKRP